MEEKQECKVDHEQECWEEVDKACTSHPKCETVVEEKCNTVYRTVCPDKEDDHEDEDQFQLQDDKSLRAGGDGSPSR